MRICPTLNNNIITNIYKTELSMTEDAPNATNHDDDGKRIASSHSYDLPNQEDDDNDVTMTEDAPYTTDYDDKDDNDEDVSFVPPDILTAVDAFEHACTRIFEEWDEDEEERKWRERVREQTKSRDERMSRWKAGIKRTTMMSAPLKQKSKASSNKDASLIKRTEISWLTKEKERKWIKEVRKERKRREERKRRCKAEIQRTTMMTMPLKQKSEAAVLVSSNKDVTTLINKTEISLSMKAIKLKVGLSTQPKVLPQSKSSLKLNASKTEQEQLPPSKQLYRAINADANFDRDNPSLYNVLSDRTPNNIKSPPSSIKSPLSSSERVTNSDANFDRDNPSSLVSNAVLPSSEFKSASYNVL
jgi:hypothetical protein